MINKNIFFGLVIAFSVTLIDQVSKLSIIAIFRPENIIETPFFSTMRIKVFSILDFVLTWNRGTCFGIGNNDGKYNVLFFSILTLIIGYILIAWMSKTTNRLILLSLGLIIGGAIGNVIDRLRFGAVVDFLYVHILAFDWWPVFNIADSSVCIGAGFLVFDSIYKKKNSNINVDDT
ncbi:MAG: signal peptidase II [Rhodospirillaceae bacterium]|jgi:signal peptidase II|nr:signal peptidase II [Rhodospirillaceae bacterium]